ncbi:hypothetical protein MSAN_00490300 [Mycena sanguinolenta]|uniref:Uncharacterized protein n=1 Tax=Mycena sanguinolenta TaxID=230812 RepID=A0A8H6Z5B4_9AGAR|nr:hypothetical protein MSAN_00490300 [Mycena sanguinolenta]
MVFPKVLASLFAMVLVAVVNANPVASPEADALSGFAKRTCTQTYTVIFKSAKSSASAGGAGVIHHQYAQLPSWVPLAERVCFIYSQLPGTIITTPVATYYDPNGGTGACPPYPVINNGDMAVAIGSGNWNSGAYCGKTMKVTYGTKTISVVIKDLCPGCQGANGIDLTEGAMAALDSNYIQHGVDNVQWSICS